MWWLYFNTSLKFTNTTGTHGILWWCDHIHQSHWSRSWPAIPFANTPSTLRVGPGQDKAKSQMEVSLFRYIVTSCWMESGDNGGVCIIWPWQSYLEYTSHNYDHNSKIIFTLDTASWWSHKKLGYTRIKRRIEQEDNIQTLVKCRTFTLNRITQFVHKTFLLMMLYHQTKFGSKGSAVQKTQHLCSSYVNPLHDLENKPISPHKTLWLMMISHKFGCKRISW